MKYNRFAIVRDWENTISAEEECLQRLCIAARDLNVECDIVDTSYRLIEDRERRISSRTHDFVLHLHYCSGKAEDVFSFGTLWNPIDFFHLWGYRRSVDTFLTNDDFLKSSSEEARLHITRALFHSTYHLSPSLFLYPAPCEMKAPDVEAVESGTLMYCGINWERLDYRKGRFSQLLKKLDEEDLIQIYGPEIFHGIKPWAGYKNYQGSVPFDGVSMIETIHRSGIALVISSESHFKDCVVSNRLFESIAAGALIISDRNPGVVKLLGDYCLYIDTDDLNKCYHQIKDHLKWIKANPVESCEMIKKCQEIFLLQLSAKTTLNNIFNNLEKRKQEVHLFRQPLSEFKLSCFFLIDQGSPIPVKEQIEIIIRSVETNRNDNISNFFLIDNQIDEPDLFKLEKLGQIIKDNFFYKEDNILGRSIYEILQEFTTEFFSLIYPGEELFKDHFSSLVKSLQLTQDDVASSDFILKREFHKEISFVGVRWNEYCLTNWSGGNFVFKKSILNRPETASFIYCLSYGIGNFLASLGNTRVSSKGATCKIHHPYQKTAKEVDSLSDMRMEKISFLISLPRKPSQQTPSLLRKVYDKYFFRINHLKKYPFVWENLKRIIKPYL